MRRILLAVFGALSLGSAGVCEDARAAPAATEAGWRVYHPRAGGELRYFIPLTEADYPPRALRFEIEGRTMVTLLLSPSGGVIECSVYQSSGYAELDEQACPLIRKRARFELNGISDNLKVTVPIAWRLLDPESPSVSSRSSSVPAPGEITSRDRTAQSVAVARIEKWSIFRSASRIEGLCYAAAEFTGGEMIAIYYDASDRKTWLLFTHSDARSLEDRDTKIVDILLQRPDGTVNDKWKQTEFTVLLDDRSPPTFVSELLDEPALDDFKEAVRMAFFENGRRIDAFSLTGTAAALVEVERCSSDLLDASRLVPAG